MSNQAPTLNRRRSTPAGFTHVVRFLDHLGVPYNKARGVSRGRREGFWQRNDGELEWIFKDAKKAYAEAAKKAHPDNGGSHQAMTALNEGWELLKRQFELHCRSMFRFPVEAPDEMPRHPKVWREQIVKARKARWEGHVYVTRAQRMESERLRHRKRRARLRALANQITITQ